MYLLSYLLTSLSCQYRQLSQLSDCQSSICTRTTVLWKT